MKILITANVKIRSVFLMLKFLIVFIFLLRPLRLFVNYFLSLLLLRLLRILIWNAESHATSFILPNKPPKTTLTESMTLDIQSLRKYASVNILTISSQTSAVLTDHSRN